MLSNLIRFGTTLLVMVVGLQLLIPLLKRLNFGQPVYDLAPESHQRKDGIPTMGGISFILAISLISLIFLGVRDEHLFVLLGMLLFGLIGFVDDIMKISARENQKGLSEWQKIGLQVIAALILTSLVRERAQSVIVPFLSRPLDLGLFYYPFGIIFILAVTNSANLTDGIDGLHASVASIMLVFFGLILWPDAQNSLFGLAVISIAALIGYFLYNRYPAALFMGDTGSMAIGGLIAMFYLITRTPLFAPIVSFIYVIESLSVILQRVYFKKTRRRIFLMAPIHHHFEQKGFSENMIVILFSAVSVIGCVVALLMYYV